MQISQYSIANDVFIALLWEIVLILVFSNTKKNWYVLMWWAQWFWSKVYFTNMLLFKFCSLMPYLRHLWTAIVLTKCISQCCLHNVSHVFHAYVCYSFVSESMVGSGIMYAYYVIPGERWHPCVTFILTTSAPLTGDMPSSQNKTFCHWLISI